jgi:hypothetical protein
MEALAPYSGLNYGVALFTLYLFCAGLDARAGLGFGEPDKQASEAARKRNRRSHGGFGFSALILKDRISKTAVTTAVFVLRRTLDHGLRGFLSNAQVRGVLSYALAGSIFSVSTPSSAKAALAFWASNWPSRERRYRAAAAMDSALTSKCFRRYWRFSLRPKPSVPSVSMRPGNHGAIWSATTFM